MHQLQHPVIVIIFTACSIAITPSIVQCSSLILILTLVLLQSALLLSIYRLTLHPLAAYPGPWYAAIAEAYNVYCCLSGDRHLKFKSWHDYYGPAVRYAPNRLSFCDEQAVIDIYGVRANTKKSSVFAGVNHIFGASATFTEIDRDFHAFKRKILGQAFQPTHFEGYASVVSENLDILTANVLADVQQDWSEPYDLSEVMKNLLADIMGDFIFSSRWNVQTSSSKRWMLDLLPLGTAGLHAAGHLISTVKLGLAHLIIPKLMQDVQRFLQLSRTQCTERIAKEGQSLRQDVFSSIIQASALQVDTRATTGYGFSMDDLVAEAGFLIIAGGDTTATTLTATLFYLLSHPNILERVREEIETACPKDLSYLSSTNIGNINETYRLLWGCINESLRLSPPVGGLLPREVLPGGLTVSGKWYVPAGFDVGVPIYAIHRDENFWKDANKFEPERWLSDHNKDCRATFMAFGVGRGSCLGKQLAYIEVVLVVARILGKYDLRMIPMSQKKGSSTVGKQGNDEEWGRGQQNEFQARDVFTSDHVGPLVSLRLRN